VEYLRQVQKRKDREREYWEEDPRQEGRQRDHLLYRSEDRIQGAKLLREPLSKGEGERGKKNSQLTYPDTKLGEGGRGKGRNDLASPAGNADGLGVLTAIAEGGDKGKSQGKTRKLGKGAKKEKKTI